MAVCYKRLLHLMIEKDVSSAELMRKANISANIISKIKNGQYMALDKVESICKQYNIKRGAVHIAVPFFTSSFSRISYR